MSTTTSARRLSRATDSRPAAPVRIVHLGVGNFFRAHQAWYTEHASDAADWGIAAFTGRSAAIAETLAPQDGLYTLVVQGAQGNDYEVIGSLSAVHAAQDLDALRGYLADPAVVIVTSTVTEAGYLRTPDGGADLANPALAADVAALREDPAGASVTTLPGKLVAGLLARRAAAGDAPITFVPCDNVSGNGEMVETVLRDTAGAVDPTLVEWIDRTCGFVTTMVDRITPRPTEADLAAVRVDRGVDDPAVVVTEPFTEWVLSGEFTGGHPDWESAGAHFVDDIDPFETRKLWLLNGSHSLMAYAATILGIDTVYDAIHDPRVRGWVDEWWDVAARHLPLPAEEIQGYRDALVERYENPQIHHLLAQIAADGSQKLPIRIVPALLADRAAGAMPTGAVRAVAAWVLHLRGLGAPVNDAYAAEVVPLAEGPLDEAVARILRRLGVDDPAVATAVVDEAEALAELSPHNPERT
ncbi:mannitol dehydrogenase family protein [Nostocoides sp. F2B08]|uniref:mannitol dehydrogenase family protein n=1 Tax=Nostocoides sp. F2B08 TaxID=2653936 RepID=UPI001262B48F|nr:mannitol dehydrogenase family protein [Tetrasphaera sp. F2B08]KAB7744253.1 mannitol dehydrogenase family protein [Tetrasphaera sp. F2B08]